MCVDARRVSCSGPVAAMSISPRLELVRLHLRSAREYLLTLLEDLQPDDWFWMPPGEVTHIAWQAGHLAMAQYGLCLFRQRGRQEVDSELMSGAFRKRFMKGTTPSTDRAGHPQPEEIRDVLDRVYRQVMLELPGFEGPGLDEAVEPPYAAFATRYGSLLFAGQHEMLHAGQIGLLRRLMGKPPLR